MAALFLYSSRFAEGERERAECFMKIYSSLREYLDNSFSMLLPLFPEWKMKTLKIITLGVHEQMTTCRTHKMLRKQKSARPPLRIKTVLLHLN